MPTSEILEFIQLFPRKVIANHMESLSSRSPKNIE
ncbi:hypothetical protein PE36_11617 [Moritella sp. PE36]|nr:hypothetical protein PE36_11617 [Moritella sp. PE36]